VKTTLLFVALLSLVCLSGCQAEPQVAPANAVSEPQAASAKAPAGALEVTYLANEGFMIEGGGRKLLIDAL